MSRKLITKTQRVWLPPGYFIRYSLGFVVLFVALAAYTLTTNKIQVLWDGVFYFSTLRSAYFDNDINYTNEAQQYPWMTRTYGEPPPDGLLSNPFPVGSAMLWAPFYTLADLVCRARMTVPCDGYGRDYIAAVMIGTVFWGTLGLVLCNMLLKMLLPDAPFHRRGLAILTVTLGSPLVFYFIPCQLMKAD